MSKSPASSDHSELAENGERSPVEVLAESFLSRLRRGEKPSVTEYADAHPHLAEEIQTVFPTLAFIESLGGDNNVPATLKGIPTSTDAPWQIGDYRVIREVGRGGMGIVYEAEHLTMKRRVALKVLPAQSAAKGSNLQRFLRETRVAGRLHHTNIVPVFEVGVEDGIHYYSMQYIRGQSLDAVINELKLLRETEVAQQTDLSGDQAHSISRSIARGLMSEGFVQTGLNEDDDDALFEDQTIVREQFDPVPLDGEGDGFGESVEAIAPAVPPVFQPEPQPPRSESSELSSLGNAEDTYFQRVARVGLQVADALIYAHSHKVLHRDIKPSNLILDTEGVIWITDFGLAKQQEETITDTGDVVGTLRYMAPEQFRGEAETRSDIYSLGLTLYELCTLKYAFDKSDRAGLVRQVALVDPPPPRSIDKRIPRDLETIILKAISKHPKDRYQTARQMDDDLRLFLEDRPIRARRIYFWERAWRRCRRNPQQAILVACVTFLLLVVFLGSLIFSYKSSQQAQLLSDENRRVVFAEAEARRAETEARESERLAKTQLYSQLRTQIELAPLLQRSGKRSQGIEDVVQAEQLLPQLDLSESQLQSDRLSLRNDAIAVLSLFDVSEVVRKKVEPPWTESLAFNSSHKLYAQSDEEGNIAIRSIDDDNQQTILPGFGALAARFAFSSDDRYLSVTYFDDQPVIYVWDLKEQKTVLEIRDSITKARVLFSSDGRRIPVGFTDGRVRIYRLPDGEIEHEFQIDGHPTTLRFSPTERKLAVAARDKPRVTVRDLATGETSRFDYTQIITEIAWLPEETLAGGCWNGNLVLWKPNGDPASPMVLEAHTAPVFDVKSSPVGNYLVSYSSDGSVRFWNMNDYREELRVESVTMLNSDFSPDGRFLGFLTEDGNFGVWQLSDQSPWKVFRNHDNPTIRWSSNFSPKAGRLLASANDSGVEFWDTHTARMSAFLPLEKTTTAFFAPDGDSLFTSGNNQLQQWPVQYSEDQAGRVTIGPPVLIRKGYIRRASVDSGSNQVAYVFGYHRFFVSGLNQEPPMTRPFGEHRGLAYTAFSPDGRWIVTSTWQGTGIQIWDATTGKMIKDLDPDSGSASPAFSPDGKLLAACNGSEINLWKVGSWEHLRRIEKQVVDSSPEPVGFSPDSRILTVPYSRFRVQLIDPHTGEMLAILQSPRPKGLNFASSFSPDGTHFAHTAGEEIHVWNLALLYRQLKRINLEWPGYRISASESEADPQPLVVEIVTQEKEG